MSTDQLDELLTIIGPIGASRNGFPDAELVEREQIQPISPDQTAPQLNVTPSRKDRQEKYSETHFHPLRSLFLDRNLSHLRPMNYILCLKSRISRDAPRAQRSSPCASQHSGLSTQHFFIEAELDRVHNLRHNTCKY